MAAAATIAQQQTAKRDGTRLTFLSRKKRGVKEDGTDDEYFKEAGTSEDVHLKYMADREREHHTHEKGPIEIIARAFGWHPKREPNTGGDPNVRAFIEKREKLTRGIFDPRSSKFIGNWDLLIMLLLLFTTIVTPYEVRARYRRFFCHCLSASLSRAGSLRTRTSVVPRLVFALRVFANFAFRRFAVLRFFHFRRFVCGEEKSGSHNDTPKARIRIHIRHQSNAALQLGRAPSSQ